MSTALEHPVGSTGADRFERARALRRRWARDAALLGTIVADTVSDGVALGSLPQWIAIPRAARTGFAVLTGAVLRSRRLRHTVDGAVLTAVAAVIGADRLDAVMALPNRVREPTPSSSRWGADPVARLHALGGEVLLRGFDGPDALRRRLAHWFPASDCLSGVEQDALHRIESDAWMLWSGRSPAASPMESR